MRARLRPEVRQLLDEAQPGGWAPEHCMHELMQAIYAGPVRGDDTAYLEFARALATEGVTRFMRIFLSLASERFVLTKIPVVWRRLRRNAGDVEAHSDGEIVRVTYNGFPFFGHRVYRLLSLANCQALAFATAGRIVPGRATSWSNDTLVLEFDLARDQ